MGLASDSLQSGPMVGRGSDGTVSGQGARCDRIGMDRAAPQTHGKTTRLRSIAAAAIEHSAMHRCHPGRDRQAEPTVALGAAGLIQPLERHQRLLPAFR